MSNGVIYPELLSGRHDEEVTGPWRVERGSTARGSASCNLTERVLEVPLERSPQARVVRAHELMHARVSPHVEHFLRALDGVTPRALECAEEFRVNTLLARREFDLTLLRDGSEKLGGRRLAEADEWGEALCFLLAVIDTGAERDFLAGVRQGRPEWVPALRAVKKRARALVGGLSVTMLADTGLDGEGRPGGFACSTLVLARLVTQSMGARVPTNPEALRAFRRSLDGGRRPASGRFAELVVESLEGRGRSGGAHQRAARVAVSGVVLRYPGRLLTDERRRAFVRRARRSGGVVVIDQSGSMDVAAEALRDLLRVAPDALIVGYSHRPGDLGATPNAWLLADRGRVATSCPAGNVGNGVDGPVLRWALDQRRRAETMVWVTDGQVTDSNDHPDDDLTRECATLVRTARIRLARELGEAVRILRQDRATPHSRLASFGRLGRALGEQRRAP